jgi:hypothetical protein
MRQPWSTPEDLRIDLTMEEVLEDLCWPGLPPGRWDVPGRETAHVDALLREVERAAPAPA